MKITEENFIEQLKKGNEKALEYVIDNYAWILKTVIKKHLYHLPNYYEECMNDCLLGIWENIRYYDPKKSSFKNWVGGIAKYKSLNYVRKYLRDLENENMENVTIPAEDNTLKEILSKEISLETEKMLKSLSEEDRGIFIKLYFEDKNMDEVSFDTGLTKPVIYNRLSRGKKRIREAFSIKGGSGNEGL
ncbi:MAG: sigma-70 family RNA polymerase sigma factor [Tepidanaerobacter acetatoxydans]|uniref:sigma-70 family RNA polymerase sigma factor n=1 Tax=Tepidanaerobacter TaxID=499228 RepID=UPI000B0A9833|nr:MULTISPECIES: sigma-70 family RNA polymerase sigma factor [Tepidanaerobacter]NLU10151.1 sigma-70 family RNA polymerase sigma factor [Tepidanaerobacter acetatoxydans]